jgi:dipeptidyl aminopeptidase/acylaminoacyl peptidase
MVCNGKKTEQAFGTWSSPITPALLSQRLRLDDIQWSGDGKKLVWLEGRSGKGVLVSKTLGLARRDLTVEHSIRGCVGYGGGEYSLTDNKVIFVERDGRLFSHSIGYEQPLPITPPFGGAAAPTISPSGDYVVYVFSDGCTDLLALIDVKGCDWPVKLVRGADFYMQPAWHPDGNFLSWIEWYHPNMPWDGTLLKLGKLTGTPPRISEEVLVAGDGETPNCQPEFSPDGRWLSYITSCGEWENLIIMDIHTHEKHILVEGDNFLLSTPAWVQGSRFYGWSHTSQRVFYSRNFAGMHEIWSVELESRKSTQVNTTPYTWIKQISVSPTVDHLAFIASGPQTPDRIVLWDGQDLVVFGHSETESIGPKMLSEPRPVNWKSKDGTSVYGWYYPPCHPNYTSEGTPPTIINIHGGPTSIHDNRYSPEAAYFTSRGYAWMEVNHRGSSGYGRSYERALHQRWGEMDVDDIAGAAEALTAQGLADQNRLILMGGSAGGYSALNTLIRYPGRFKAGIIRYGVSNLFTLTTDTHKFESHYTNWLVGNLPDAAERYLSWSPIYNADRIQDPIAIFQGTEDNVVSPNQSEKIVNALRKNGIPHIYRLYDGEGHGFRQQKTLEDYYQQIDIFLKQHVLFAP